MIAPGVKMFIPLVFPLLLAAGMPGETINSSRALDWPVAVRVSAVSSDPGAPDTLRLGMARSSPANPLVIPVFFFSDEQLGGIQVVLKYDKSQLVCDSVSFVNTTLTEGGTLVTIDSAAGTINAGVIYVVEKTIPPQTGRFGDIYLSMITPPHADTFWLDTTTIPIDTVTVVKTVFSQSNPAVSIFPEFVPAPGVFVGYEPGDADGNGRLNIGDVTFLIQRIFAGGPAPPILNAADPNADCRINIGDVTFLVQWIFVGGSEPQLGCVEP